MQARQIRPPRNARLRTAARTLLLSARRLVERRAGDAFARAFSVGVAALTAAVVLALPSGAGLLVTLWMGSLRPGALARTSPGARRARGG